MVPPAILLYIWILRSVSKIDQQDMYFFLINIYLFNSEIPFKHINIPTFQYLQFMMLTRKCGPVFSFCAHYYIPCTWTILANRGESEKRRNLKHLTSEMKINIITDKYKLLKYLLAHKMVRFYNENLPILPISNKISVCTDGLVRLIRIQLYRLSRPA